MTWPKGRPRRLDVTDKDSIEQLRAQVDSAFGRLDVLVNNAAILYDTWQRALMADLAVVREALETNTLGTWQMCQVFVPLLRRSPHGRIVNVSQRSGLTGQYGRGNTGLQYIEGRAQCAHADAGRVATDMGGAGGRPVAEGAASVLWAVTLPDGGPTGGFFRDGKLLPW